MRIRSSEFIKGIKGSDDILYDGVPQIAFIGRSNVGKSSLINAVVNKNELVKVGKKPGKTTELNFFSINNKECYLVDLPGYGYARLGEEERESIKKMILWYLMYSEVKPFQVVLVLDIKAGCTDFDMELIGILREMGHHFLIVANKADKMNQKELSAQMKQIQNETGEQGVFAYSAETRENTDKLLKVIFD